MIKLIRKGMNIKGAAKHQMAGVDIRQQSDAFLQLPPQSGVALYNMPLTCGGNPPLGIIR